MIPITNPAIEDYLFQLASRYDEPVLKAMEEYGHKYDDVVIVARRKE